MHTIISQVFILVKENSGLISGDLESSHVGRQKDTEHTSSKQRQILKLFMNPGPSNLTSNLRGSHCTRAQDNLLQENRKEKFTPREPQREYVYCILYIIYVTVFIIKYNIIKL